MSEYVLVTLILLFSILVQMGAMFMALRLIRITESQMAWSLIAMALVLMAVRRIIPLYRLVSGDQFNPPDTLNEFIGLVLSVMMFIGITRIAPLFIERKRAEEALQTNEGRFRQSQAVGHIGSWQYDIPTTRFWGSDEAKRLYGFDPEQDNFSVDEVERCIPERERVHQALVDLIEAGKPYNLEFEIHPRNLTESRIIASIAELQKADHGRPLRVLGVIQDITARKRTETALRKSEAELREAQRLGRLGSWDWDATTDTITWSEEYYHIYGLDPIQRPPGYVEHLQAYTPESAARLDAAVKKNMEMGEPYELDLELVRPDAPSRWITARSETKRDADGRIVGLRGTAQDITERKRAEEEIRKLNQELEQRVLERTAELEIANKELADFSYSVSHDLRAPLRHVDAFLELLRERMAGSLDAQSQHYMANISESSKRMGVLIDSLLSFCRMRRRELTQVPVNLNDLVREAIRELVPEAIGRNIHWQIADLPMVTGDRAMLRVVLVNLISNALKFTQPREQAEIEIGWLREQGTETVIFVRDNGVGFDMNYADKLFGVFQRLHREDEFEGTGIGLANVRRIINRHGGRTWAEGKVDHGATFYFSLPQTMKDC